MLALNAWALQVPELRRAIVAVSSDMIATAPMPEKLAASGWTGGECVSNSRLMVHYYRTTKDGRVAFGRGGGRIAFGARVNENFDYNERQTRELKEELPQLVRGRWACRSRTRGEGRSTEAATGYRSSAPARAHAHRLRDGLFGERRGPVADRREDPRVERASP